jgi:hypothetical protein
VVLYLWDAGAARCGSEWKAFQTPECAPRRSRTSAILTAIEARDARKARAAMRGHIRRVSADLAAGGAAQGQKALRRRARGVRAIRSPNGQMNVALTLHEDRPFSSDTQRASRAALCRGRAPDREPAWPHRPALVADDEPFKDPAALFITPDHYVFRMLYSHGVALEDLGVPSQDDRFVEDDPRRIWRLAKHWHLFRGTPTRMWFDHAFYEVFGIREARSSRPIVIYDRLADALARPEFRRARSSTDSTSKFWRQPSPRSTRSPRETRKLVGAGADHDLPA